MKIFIIFLIIFTTSLFSQDIKEIIKISEDLEVISLSSDSFIHISYMSNPSYGRFGCNGLIYKNNNEAVFFDTPHTDSLTLQLLNWFKNTFPDVKIKAVVVNHFHNDCVAGLDEFHKLGVSSYSYKTTPELASNINLPVPQKTFSDSLSLAIGDEKIICRYLGEAHTADNIVAYIPSEKILFGGCMVKSLGSGKGNLADANVDEWPETIKKVKEEFSETQFVIPGHGSYGGKELLDFTIELFSKK